MNEGERRIADTPGRFLRIVEDGREVDEARWKAGRLLLSNRRLVLVGREGKRTVPISDIDGLGVWGDGDPTASETSEYTSLGIGEDVLLVAAPDHDTFEVDLYSAVLDGEILLVRHPAASGVERDTDWEKARVAVDEDGRIDVRSSEGTSVSIGPGDVVDVVVVERTVHGQSRHVVEVEHADQGTGVVTYLAGPRRTCAILGSFFEREPEGNSSGRALDATEREVLMALYSGISSFEIPEFTGVEVDEIEDTFERLIELDVLDEVRTRREVALTPRGRNLASEAIGDE